MSGLAPKEQHPGNSQAKGPNNKKASGERHCPMDMPTEGVSGVLLINKIT